MRYMTDSATWAFWAVAEDGGRTHSMVLVAWLTLLVVPIIALSTVSGPAEKGSQLARRVSRIQIFHCHLPQTRSAPSAGLSVA